MIRDLGESFGNRILDSVGRIAGRAQEQRPLPSDLLESDNAYLAVFDAPDASAADIQVRFSDSTVYVRIDRVREFHEGFEMRFPGRGLELDGQVELPADAVVDSDNATAMLTDTGTLRVELPKRENSTDEPIRISTDEGADSEVDDGDDTPTNAVERIDDEHTNDG
jgi:HSP20 family protein